MKKMVKKLFISLSGLFIGVINGFFGGGGGMVCVPVLEKLMEKPVKKSHATAILVILPISIASAVLYIMNGYFDITQGGWAALGVVSGGVAGAFLLKKLSNGVLTMVFALVMIAAGIKQFF